MTHFIQSFLQYHLWRKFPKGRQWCGHDLNSPKNPAESLQIQRASVERLKSFQRYLSHKDPEFFKGGLVTLLVCVFYVI